MLPMQANGPHGVEIHFLVCIGLGTVGQFKEGVVSVVEKVLQQFFDLFLALLTNCVDYRRTFWPVVGVFLNSFVVEVDDLSLAQF